MLNNVSNEDLICIEVRHNGVIVFEKKPENMDHCFEDCVEENDTVYCDVEEINGTQFFRLICSHDTVDFRIMSPLRYVMNGIPLKKLFKEFQPEIISFLDCIKSGIWITDDEAVSLAINESSHHIVEKNDVDRSLLINRKMEDLKQEGYINHSAAISVVKEQKECRIIQKSVYGEIDLYTIAVPFFMNDKLQLVVCTDFNITEATKRKKLFYKGLDNRGFNSKALIASKEENRNVNETAVFASDKMKSLVKLIKKVAVLDTTILIQGETGTGKEVIADFIYKNSSRKDEPFIKINCSAIPENLLESELFGYVEGAFIGAKKNGKKGIFEEANNGTLFLDEIGDIPFNLQAKLLRALQEREIYRVGSSERIQVDVRIIAATNVDLKAAVDNGTFREDLYYRLNVVPVSIPPLRERKEDIVAMIDKFTKEFCQKYNFSKTFSDDSYVRLLQYEWPGNVRELKNVIERILVMSDGNVIERHEIFLPENKSKSKNPLFNTESNLSLEERMELFEKELLEELVFECRSANKIAELLQVNRSTISRKLKKYDIDFSTIVDV